MPTALPVTEFRRLVNCKRCLRVWKISLQMTLGEIHQQVAVHHLPQLQKW